MDRLGVDVALVLPSTALDDFPIWSPDSRFVAGNIMGKWHKLDLAHLVLALGTWRGGQSIGVLQSRGSISPLSEALLKGWMPAVEPDPDAADNGTIRIEFDRRDLGTKLVLTRNGQASVTLWAADLEACGAPVFSPDAGLVAFICETNGIVVLRVR
jgi:hypothetical protein